MDAVLGPIDGVVVVVVLGCALHPVILAARVIGCVTLAEVVGKSVCGVGAEELPVDLVQALGLQDGARHNALAFGGLHDHLDTAEEDVEGRQDGGRVSTELDGEVGVVVNVRYGTLAVLRPDIGVEAVGKVEGGVGAERRHIRTARGVEGVAFGVGLGQGSGKQAAGEEGRSREGERVHGRLGSGSMDRKRAERAGRSVRALPDAPV